MLPYGLPLPQSPLVDQQTGTIGRDWYIFLTNLFANAGSGTSTLSINDIEALSLHGVKRSEKTIEDVIAPRTNSTAVEKRVAELEEYVTTIKRNRKPRINTTSVTYPALTLIQTWAGAIGSIPAGFQLCDGTAGAPDMRNLFVIGAGSTYAVGATGGSATIALNNLPTHTHAYNDQYNITTANQTNLSYTAGGTVLSVTTSVTETPTTAAATTGNNTTTATPYLQPYYALAYIVNTTSLTMITGVSLVD